MSLPAGPVSPPPLQSTDSAKAANYPAVLKGRTNSISAALPPNPNLVPSGKVPPPVPPRGSGGGSHNRRGSQSDTGSSTSGRGDFRFRSYNNNINNNYTKSHFLHERLDTLHENVAYHRTKNTQKIYSKKSRQSSTIFEPTDQEEFVSVERIADSFVIRTSPYPFRPERGKFKFRQVSTNAPTATQSNCTTCSSYKSQYQKKAPTPSIPMPKFTYFIDPKNNPDLMNYKMSRLDKKHSETYAERMRRLQDKNARPAPSPPTLLVDSRVVRREIPRTVIQEERPSPGFRLIERVQHFIRKSPGGDNLQVPVASGNNNYNGMTFLGDYYLKKSEPQNNGRIFRDLTGRSPNVYTERYKRPETLQKRLNDEEYAKYLREQSLDSSNSGSGSNKSFLHGYVWSFHSPIFL